MATAYITELREMTNMAGTEKVQAVKLPAVAEQTVTFTGTAGQSAAFNQATTAIRIYLSADGYILVGTNPTATTSMLPVTAKVAEYFGVPRGSKISIVAAA